MFENLAVGNILTLGLVILVNAAGLWVAQAIVKGVYLRSFGTYVISGLILAVVNFFIKPLLVLLTLPITIVTLGLFIFVINALLLMLVAKIVPGFSISKFSSALLAAIVIAIFNFVLNSVV